MAPEEPDERPPPTTVAVARTSVGKEHYNTIKVGYCYLYAQLYDDDMQAPLAGIDYTIRAIATRFTASAKTDENGIMRNEGVPDDHYELTCEGVTEPMELLFHEHRSRHEGNPWALRLRNHKKER